VLPLELLRFGEAALAGEEVAVVMIARPERTPGRRPAMKSFTMDAPVIAPKRIMGMEGGMMIAIVAEAESTAAAKRGG
jgi:hypothetical protein